MQNFNDLKSKFTALLANVNVDYAEIRTEDSRDLGIAYVGTQLERVRRNDFIGGNVRALHRGGWGFVSFNDIEELEASLQLACEQARAAGGVVNEESMLAPVPTVVDDVTPTWNMHPEKVSLDEKIQILGQYHKQILAYDDIPAAYAVMRERCTTLVFANSEGSCIRQEKVDFAFAVGAEGKRGDVSVDQSVSDGSSDGISKLFGREDEIDEMCKRTQELLSAPVITAGVYTTVCDPELTGLFIHEAFGHLSEADDLVNDPDFLKAMTMGRVLGRPILNIYDTGDVVTGRGYMVYDEEGVACTRADLVKEGVLVGRLNNRWSSAKLGEPVTGSSRALDFNFPPIVRMRNTCIESGSSTFEDMIKDVKLGVYALGTGGGGETNGEMFNFGADYGYIIRDGKLCELVRDVKLMGNVFTTMENIDMIGNDACGQDSTGGCGKADQSPLPTSNVCPHIRIQNVIIGGVQDEN